MAKLLSTKAPLRFVPQDQAARPECDQIAYHILPPSVYSAPQLNRALKSRGARVISTGEVLDVLEEGIRALLPNNDQAEVLEERLAVVADFRAWSQSDSAEQRVLAELDRDHEVHELFRIVAQHYPKLADLAADRDWFWDVLGIEAARLQVHDWDNLSGSDGAPLACRRGLDGLTDDSLQAIPKNHLQAIGIYVSSLLRPTEREAKNSGSPPPGPRAPSSSKATAKTPPKKTPSKTTPGRSRKSASKS